MDSVINEIRKQLALNSDSKTRETNQNFFKEKIKLYGVKAPVVSKISKEFYKAVRDFSKTEIFDLCDSLWQSGYIEESFIACNWSYFIHKDYEPGDFEIFTKWVETYVNNWASCDTFCNHTIGEFIEMYPVFLTRLKDFTRSGNRWMRRAAAVSLIVPAKKGMFLNDILGIAGLLLIDKDDMVQKGYGWMLKEASRLHQQEIYEYVISKKSIMPRTALRYAIEKMPKELRDKAMAK
jgi:3-methyladenine DNA glycosylase AlkD